MNLTDATGEVMTPGFSSGSNYPNDIDCKWYIIAEEGKTIILTFTAMDIEASPGVTLDCYFDSLEVTIFRLNVLFINYRFSYCTAYLRLFSQIVGFPKQWLIYK